MKFAGTRQFVGAHQLVDTLFRLDLTEEEILSKIVEAKQHPGRIVAAGPYRFRWDEGTQKYEDNLVSTLITRVLEGEDPDKIVEGV